MRLPGWRLRRELPPGPPPWSRLQEAWGLGPASARLAWLRGLDEPGELGWRLDASWDRLGDPLALHGVGEAADQIRKAVSAGRPVWVYGDYDVDGVTATALLVRCLERLGARCGFFIPNRFSDGYGLNLDCIRELATQVPGALVVSVDCGVRSVEEVAASADLGLDWIITDHHTVGERLPRSLAVVHPALGESPDPHLSGVGVAFRLAQALLEGPGRSQDRSFLEGLLKLVAIGTLADMVPLVGRNAWLVRQGLQAMGGKNGPGLAALLRAARVVGAPRSADVAFGLAPRLNAVGRMGGAEDAVRLLLTRDPGEAARLMEFVERLNQQRKLEQKGLSSQLPPLDGKPFDLAVEPSAHKGVIGIIAGRRMRESGRPAGVCTVDSGVVQCSLRAPEGYDLVELLHLAGPFLRTGGGHRGAAGITFDPSKLAFVRQSLERGAEGQARSLPPPAAGVDGHGASCVPDPEELGRLEPFGQGFPVPAVVLEGRLEAPPRTFAGEHLRIPLGGVPEPVNWYFGKGREAFLRTGETLALVASPQDHPTWGRSWVLETFLGEAT
ncbi:MAG: DHH family phosphoesterase [Acidobacteria bacterium]|nr:DHH family phosphoesterase [Acidobacteriota bacterium]